MAITGLSSREGAADIEETGKGITAVIYAATALQKRNVGFLEETLNVSIKTGGIPNVY